MWVWLNVRLVREDRPQYLDVLREGIVGVSSKGAHEMVSTDLRIQPQLVPGTKESESERAMRATTSSWPQASSEQLGDFVGGEGA